MNDRHLFDRIEQPSPRTNRLASQLRFLVEVDRLKTVIRRSPLVADDRRENDAEHSWHLALMVLVLSEYSDESIDLRRTMEMVVIHDLVEIHAGDTFLYDAEGQRDQEERERQAADRLFALLPADQRDRLRRIWDEFEARESPEARFAKAVDRLQPLLLNFNNSGGTWDAPGVTEADVRHRQAVIADASAELWTYAATLIEVGTHRGWLKRRDSSKPVRNGTEAH